MTVRFSRRAITQIAEAVAHIQRDDPGAASGFAVRMERLASLLSRHPEIGRATDMPGVRVMPTQPYPYLMFYKLAGDGITVLRVRHMARREDWRTGR